MKLSPFTPLHFSENNPSDGLPSRYVQTWAPTDQIMIQVVAATADSAPTATLYDAITNESIGTITWNSWAINSDTKIFFHVYEGLSEGYYKLTIADKTSDIFRVTSDEIALEKTTLIQYRNKDNKQRDDAVFVVDNVPYFFDFRIPGGFKDSGWTFGVNNEQFDTQFEDVVELYAYEYTAKSLTMGGSIGVPVWYGDLLNRLLTCHFVYVNGERYSRSDTESPQMNVLVDGLDSFVFTQTLRRVVRIEADYESLNQVAIRRVDNTYNRISDSTNENVIILEI